MEQGRDVILEIELQGALKIREQYPDALLLFVMPPDAQTLADRLRGRGTETEEVIQARLARAVEEAREIEAYDYMVVNDELEQSVEAIHHLIDSQHNLITRNLDFVETVREELKAFAKGE